MDGQPADNLLTKLMAVLGPEWTVATKKENSGGAPVSGAPALAPSPADRPRC
ncbi:hypothetical protein ACTOB_006529 [Actinoplanes oblitus]|uniref:Uncharacterized protein n=1 Tax=Actinoplanes oblitus TaxID=3040509 RepID=A0ABY8W9G0_9ACTN|nr:hypothetical protein [Actinoplanes oblitus]WIM94504.1 hypothetical protein ACTOB_006529 [Actinoplanes oblitus]